MTNACVEFSIGNGPEKASIIWLHGLGADGHDFVPFVQSFSLPESHTVRFILPHAPTRPVSLNQGFVMPAWYDIHPDRDKGPEDEAGLRASEKQIAELIDFEIQSGVLPENIILAGFSQGGAMVLQTGLRYPKRLGGLVVLSAYLPLREGVAKERSPENQHTPIWMAHGTDDVQVPTAWGWEAFERLQALDYSVRWQTYSMEHSVCEPERVDLEAFLRGVLCKS